MGSNGADIHNVAPVPFHHARREFPRENCHSSDCIGPSTLILRATDSFIAGLSDHNWCSRSIRKVSQLLIAFTKNNDDLWKEAVTVCIYHLDTVLQVRGA